VTVAQTYQFPTNAMEVRPGIISQLLAKDGKTFGYGYGPGWSLMFGLDARNDVTVYPGQWVTRYADDRVTVTDERPENTDIYEWKD
jgi:hypothetical protein